VGHYPPLGLLLDWGYPSAIIGPLVFKVVVLQLFIRVRDFPLSIGVYHQSFLIAISQPPRLGIEPRLSELLIIIILVLYGIVSPKLNQTGLR
jgi:hypothetical protein